MLIFSKVIHDLDLDLGIVVLITVPFMLLTLFSELLDMRCIERHIDRVSLANLLHMRGCTLLA